VSDLLEQTKALRDRALAQLQTLPEYRNWAALKAAVEEMTRVELSEHFKPRRLSAEPERSSTGTTIDVTNGRRIPQGDAAATALRRGGTPLPGAILMSKAREVGAVIGGEKPVVSFTSTLSKDSRFYSFRHDGMYYWWFKDEPLPLNWKGMGSDDFDDLLDPISQSSSQEGGDGHGPATT